MTTLARHITINGAENRPPMLEKSMYDSWASRIHLFIKGKKYGRMMLDSNNNCSLIYLTIEEKRQTRPMKYSELTEAQQLQDHEGFHHQTINLEHCLRLEIKQPLKLVESQFNKFKEDKLRVMLTEDLDAYDSDCDDLSSAKMVLMENLLRCDPVLFEVPYSDSYPNDMINQDVQEMQYSEQTHIEDFQDNEIYSDSNIIMYS
nr:hypothetical protein [Tanacetum cinerariifolium]